MFKAQELSTESFLFIEKEANKCVLPEFLPYPLVEQETDNGPAIVLERWQTS